MNRFLLDTNILSEPLKLHPNQAVVEMLQRHEQEAVIASVTWHEILFGCYRLPVSRKRQKIEQYLIPFRLICATNFSLAPPFLRGVGGDRTWRQHSEMG